ncbi:MAG TPA: glycerate kinase [Candidatus Baltobacteraceae bacterium]|nr:glycerate kinase [Candidatus Baltobacteraceae bacterium]
MRVVIAPDKFKGRLTAAQAADAIERGMRAVLHDAEFVVAPMADGGEGTVDAFIRAGAQPRAVRVHGPLGDPVDAVFAVLDDTAIIEMAAASGLELLAHDRRDVMHADTYGTGELLLAALDAGARRVIVGAGGSATNDAGTGFLRALGARFIDETGEVLDRAIARYARLEEIDLTHFDSRVRSVPIVIASDVDNPLCGSRGASRTYAAQKGANPAQIALLDLTFDHVADVAARTLRRDQRDSPGAGAAGGLGYALLEFLGARLERGVNVIAEELDLTQALHGASLCVTGEGKIDDQTLHGKTVSGVAELARAQHVPVVAFAGVVEPRAKVELEERGITVREADSGVLESAARDYAAQFATT